MKYLRDTKQNPSPQGFTYWGETSKPPETQVADSDSAYSLATAKPGSILYIVGFPGKQGEAKLKSMGLSKGTKLQIVHKQPSGSVFLTTKGKSLAVGAGMANQIMVSDCPLANSEAEAIITYIRQMKVGSVGQVVGYDQVRRGYKGRLLSMGLTPGTKFKIVRIAPLGDPVEIKLRGFHLSLRKQEADALVVEEINV